MTRGHIIPKSLGGPDALWNIRPEHLSCNQQRGNHYTREDLLEAWERMSGKRPLGPRPRPIRLAPASVERLEWDNTPMPGRGSTLSPLPGPGEYPQTRCPTH